MTEPERQATEIISQLDQIDQLRPTEELQAYETVLGQLTEMLNASEHYGPGET